MNKKNSYQSFCQFAQGHSFSLIGLGVSNLPLVSFLLNAGASRVTVRDLKKNNDDPFVIQAKNNGGEVILGPDYLMDLSEEYIIRSPVIRPDIPEFSEAKEKYGSEVFCETELFLRFATCKTIAVTGSDGKTTTTTLISKMLEQEGYQVILGGNIGFSMLSQLQKCDSERAIAVLELSSFQLMGAKQSPNVAVITNLAENHLDWHLGMWEYLEAKKNLILHQEKNDLAIFNLDNSYTKELRSVGKTCHFSYLSRPKDNGIFFENGAIYKKERNEITFLLNTEKILLPGQHNVENYMAAIGAVWDLVSLESILQVASSFRGVAHRIEWIRNLNGVDYYNSSIDSSPSRSTACLRAFQKKIVMIAGGYDKKLDYTALGKEICEHVKVLILCGATAEKIKTAVNNADPALEKPKIIECEQFSALAEIARNVAIPGDAVVLSPASASFDMFRNFEERGNLFKKMVMELK